MVKNKKNIADFQRALQSQAQFIVPDSETAESKLSVSEEVAIQIHEEIKTVPQEFPEKENKDTEALIIDEEIAMQLRLLSEHTGRGYDELVRHALTHFLMLKGLRLRDALMEFYQKEVSLRDL